MSATIRGSIESATTAHRGEWTPRHAVGITDPGDYSTAIEAAETLDLSLARCKVMGSWETHPDCDAGLGDGFFVEIEKAGRAWFHLKFSDGEVLRARPTPSDVLEDGTLRLLFD